jgi:hypothetical protein
MVVLLQGIIGLTVLGGRSLFAEECLSKHKKCLSVFNQVVRSRESCVVEIKFIKGDDGDEQIDGICLDGPAAVAGPGDCS